MAKIPGLPAAVYFGEANTLPDWRRVASKVDPATEDDEPSKEDLESVKTVLGFDPDEIDEPDEPEPKPHKYSLGMRDGKFVIRYAATAENCGTGAGGFQKGNECAVGGRGGVTTASSPHSGKRTAKPNGTKSKFKFPKPSKAKAKLYEAQYGSYSEKEYAHKSEILFGRIVDKSDLASLVGAPDDSEVTISERGAGLAVDFESERMYASRVIYSDYDTKEISIKNKIFFLRGERGQGIGAEVFGRQVENAIAAGAVEILCEAGKSANMNGYYTWPRFGYDGNIPPSVKEILPEQFKDFTRVSQFMMTPEGREWWKANGEQFEATFDLREGSLSRRIWEAYKAEKAKQKQESSSPTSVQKMKRSLIRFGIGLARYARTADNCGTGAGGFQRGNECAAGSARGKQEATSEKRSKKLEVPKVAKQPLQKSESKAKPLPPEIKQALSIPAPTSERDAVRFVNQVKQTKIFKEVYKRLDDLSRESPNNDVRLWSLARNTDENGKLTPERQVLHDKITNKFLNPKAVAKPGEKPKVMFLMGAPGSGKSTAGQAFVNKLGVEFTLINADDVKAEFPEYKGWNAAAVHEESSMIAEHQLQEAAITERHNILFDLTGTNTAKMERMMNEFYDLGYEIHMVMASLPYYKSVGRTWSRFAKNAFSRADLKGEPGRFVTPDYVINDVDYKPPVTFKKLKESGKISSYVSLDTDVPMGEKPKVIERG